ncbi:MAG: hypothetical protein K2H28_08510, partial [Ruminococcus sp.]|nr:hypothetical protein [Ruminococcus sp.]
MLKKVFAGLAALIILVSVNPINNTIANNLSAGGQKSTVATEISDMKSSVTVNAKDGAIILTSDGASASNINT